MSNYLGYFDGEIPLSSAKLDVHNTLKSNFLACSWQIVTDDATNYVLDVIPPATETIGDGRIREVLRFKTENLAIRCYGYMQAVTDYLGQTFTLEQTVGGATPASVTIGGVTVSQSLPASEDSPEIKLHQLFLDLKASVDPIIMDWDFFYYPPYTGQVSGGTTPILTAFKKTITSSYEIITVGGGNTTLWNTTAAGMVAGTPQQIGCSFIANHTTSPHVNLTRDLTIDLTNGFVYWMSVFGRTVYLVTECNSGMTGPVCASWVDNTEARAVTPKGTPQIAVPIELYVMCMDTRYGYTNTTSDNRHSALLTHSFSFCEGNPGNIVSETGPESGWSTTAKNDAFLRMSPSRTWFNSITYDNFNGTASNRWYANLGGMFGYTFASLSTMDDFAIQVAAAQGYTYLPASNSNTGGTDWVLPPANLPDVYTMLGNAPSKSVHLAADDTVVSTTTADYDGTTAYPTLAVASTTGFPASGFAVLNNEVWSYTGQTPTSLTGCIRAQQGTKAEPTSSGSEIRPGVWFVRMSRAALRAGYTKPV